MLFRKSRIKNLLFKFLFKCKGNLTSVSRYLHRMLVKAVSSWKSGSNIFIILAYLCSRGGSSLLLDPFGLSMNMKKRKEILLPLFGVQVANPEL